MSDVAYEAGNHKRQPFVNSYQKVEPNLTFCRDTRIIEKKRIKNEEQKEQKMANILEKKEDEIEKDIELPTPYGPWQ